VTKPERTSVQVRIPADERVVGVSLLVTRALESALDRWEAERL
jgi:hypothetical protein